MKINDFWMLRLSRLIATDSNPKTENNMKKGKDIFNVIKLEQKGASAKLLQLQLEANEILHSERGNYQSRLSAKRISVALAEIRGKVVELEDSPRKSEFLKKLDSILSKLREYYQFHERYWSGAEALDSENELINPIQPLIRHQKSYFTIYHYFSLVAKNKKDCMTLSLLVFDIL